MKKKFEFNVVCFNDTEKCRFKFPEVFTEYCNIWHNVTSRINQDKDIFFDICTFTYKNNRYKKKYRIKHSSKLAFLRLHDYIDLTLSYEEASTIEEYHYIREIEQIFHILKKSPNGSTFYTLYNLDWASIKHYTYFTDLIDNFCNKKPITWPDGIDPIPLRYTRLLNDSNR
jgi:hypothetical protein